MNAPHGRLRVIEPDEADLIRPDLAMAETAAPSRDVEDAVFETVHEPRSAGVDHRAGAELSGGRPSGPVMRHAAPIGLEVRCGKRTGVFSRIEYRSAPEQYSGLFGSVHVYTAAVSAMALIAFWMAGGHALLVRPNAKPLSHPAAVAATPAIETAAVPETRQMPAAAAIEANGEIFRPAPHPARIERAGSILMIRPQGR